MKIAFLIAVLATSTLAAGQNITVQSSFKCKPETSSIGNEAKQKLGPLFDHMVNEGPLISWNWYDDAGKQVIELIVENEGRFKQVMDMFRTRSAIQYPDLYKSFSSACQDRKDTIFHRVTLFPAIKSNFYSGVIQVPTIDEVPDPALNYNLVFDFTAYQEGSRKNTLDSVTVNWGLTDIGRIYNLHVAAGVPREKLHFVVAVHAAALRSFYSNEAYRKRYKTDNPNLKLIKELNDAGVRFLMCGQAMTWLGIEKPMLIPEAKVTLTAQTTITSYQLKGYAILPVHND